MRGLQHVGVAIHPTLNLINHHCNPNTIAVSCGPQIYVRATKPIKKGDELFICYVDQGATSKDRKGSYLLLIKTKSDWNKRGPKGTVLL